MEDYLLEYKSRKIKDTTILQYKNDLRIILIYILEHEDNRLITDLTKKDFRRFLLYLLEDCHLSNSRANRLMSCCRSFLNFVEDEEEYAYENNQAAKIKGLPKESVRKIVFLKDDAIMLLYQYFMDNGMYRDATLLALAYESAGRKSELLQVNKDTIVDISNCTNKVTGKRGKTFNLIYFEMTQKAGKKYLKERRDSIPYLFLNDEGKPATTSNVYYWVLSWRKIYYKLTGENTAFNLHSFRHSALENYSLGTHEVCRNHNLGKVPIEKLSLLANHSSIAITQTYLKDKTNEELCEFFHIKNTCIIAD